MGIALFPRTNSPFPAAGPIHEMFCLDMILIVILLGIGCYLYK